MKNYFKHSLLILILLSASRFVPHPPNFTSLIALSFYLPALLGPRYILSVLTCFAVTDLIIGFHSTVFFTWGSVVLIGYISKYFLKNLGTRFIGVLLGATIFYIITNLGVWMLGSYGYTFNGLLICYTLALPFFGYTLISTLIFSGIIEGTSKLIFFKIKSNSINN